MELLNAMEWTALLLQRKPSFTLVVYKMSFARRSQSSHASKVLLRPGWFHRWILIKQLFSFRKHS